MKVGDCEGGVSAELEGLKKEFIQCNDANEKAVCFFIAFKNVPAAEEAASKFIFGVKLLDLRDICETSARHLRDIYKRCILLYFILLYLRCLFYVN